LNSRRGEKAAMSPETKSLSRRARKKERTRQEIYAAASKLFAGRSYHEVTVEEICEEADVARTTFFAHFPSKSALLLEYSRGIATRFRESHGDPEATATEQLHALATLVMESWFAQAEVMGAMLLEFSLPTAARLETSSEEMPIHQLVADIIRRGRARGEFRPGLAADVAAHAFLSAGSIVLAAAAERRAQLSPEELREEFLDWTLHGLARAPDAG
jgi:AcrR family transcriptional regulator